MRVIGDPRKTTAGEGGETEPDWVAVFVGNEAVEGGGLWGEERDEVGCGLG